MYYLENSSFNIYVLDPDCRVLKIGFNKMNDPQNVLG